MRLPHHRARLLALVAALSSILSFGVSAGAQTVPLQVDRVTARVDAGTTAALTGHVPSWVKTAPDLGPVPATDNVDLNIVMARAPEVQAAFDQLVQDQQNPKSAMYHQWLTPQQVGTLYGPTQHDLDAVTGWLTSAGFQVKNVAANRIMIEASAPAQLVESVFRTQLHTFQVRNEGTLDKVQAPLTEPSVPAALQGVIASIGGLSNVPMHVHSRHATAPMAFTNIQPKNGTAAAGAKVAPDYTLSNGVHLLSPADFAVIYDINSAYAAGTKGNGVNVMIIGGVRLNSSDLAEWESLSALPTYQPNYKLGSNFTDPGYASSSNDDGEETLDFERVYGTAPGATVDEVIAANWLSGTVNYSLQSYAINNVGDPIMTMSFSACEADQSPAYLAQENTLYQQAASQGISVFASSGDSGVDNCEDHNATAQTTQIASISDICASPYVTCVGGTEFNDTANPSSYWSASNGTGELSALSYIPEGAWNEPTSVSSTGVTSYVVAATGGGFSTSQPKPTFQTGTGVPADGHRDVPDVSFSASAHNGYFSCLTSAGASCTNGMLVYFSGTSASAPSMAGITALVDQRIGAKQGNLNTLLYKVAGEGGGAFNDATPTSSGVGSACTTATPSMCNNSDPSPTALTGGLAGYPLTAGYDEATGLGSIDVAKFLAVAALPVPTGTITAMPTTITVSQTAAFSVTLTGSGATPTGTIQFTSNGVNLGSPVTIASGTATSPAESFPAAATYSIAAVYSGDSNYSPNSLGPILFVVTNPNGVASTSTLTASATTLTQSQTVTFTDTVTGGSGTPTGKVQFLIDGANQGTAVTLNGSGVATLGPMTLAVGTHSITASYTGDKTYNASTSNAVAVTVNALASTTSIAISASTTSATGYLVFAGTVAGVVGGGPVPTGTLDLYYQGSSILQSPLALTNGSLAVALLFSGSGIPAGSYPVMWVYSGDSNYLPSQSATATFTISSSFTPTYTLTPTNATVTATSGTAATNTITLASSNGYSSSATLSCSAAFTGSSTDTVVEPTCSFSPATINLLNDQNAYVNAAGVYETSTVTLTTVTPHDKQRAANEGFRSLGAFGGTALAGLVLFSIPALRRRRHWNALACVLLLAAAAGISGCGSGGSGSGGGGGGGGGGGTLTGTPNGNYTITVTGTGGVTTTFTLSVN